MHYPGASAPVAAAAVTLRGLVHRGHSGGPSALPSPVPTPRDSGLCPGALGSLFPKISDLHDLACAILDAWPSSPVPHLCMSKFYHSFIIYSFLYS